ncbi:MAG: divergent polysaccharide deacetylase family protein [Candidatus Omnitrophota bacterium]
MTKRLKLFIVLGIVVFFFWYSFFHVKDATKTISNVESSVLSLLNEYGIKNTDIVSRDSVKWKKSTLRGETISYVFSPAESLPAARIPKQVESCLKPIKKTLLKQNLFYFDKDTPVLKLEIVYRKQPVLIVIIKNIKPDWMALAYDKEEKTRVSKEIVKHTPVPKKSVEKEQITENKNPKIALILDDFGYSKRNLNFLKELKIPVTLAVLPETPYARAICAFAEKNGCETIVHLPMQPENEDEDLEKDTVTVDMKDQEVRNCISNAFKSVYTAKGLSNHMGSRATKNKDLMAIVIKELKDANKFFVDSYTTNESVCEELAKENNVPYIKRDMFIDNKSDQDYIERQLEKVQEMALAKGSAVAIGHDRVSTMKALQKMVPKIKSKGVEFVFLPRLMNKNKPDH